MRILLLTSLSSLFLFQYAAAQERFCKSWYIEPVLYNNMISDSTHTEFWENYWYQKSGDDSKLIPDSLCIILQLTPSISILPLERLPQTSDSNYRIVSSMFLKYGEYDRSYNVINPIVSDSILLLDEYVNLMNIYRQFTGTEQMGYSFYPRTIPLKRMLRNLNISLGDEIWDQKKRGKPLALNQIIIKTYFIDSSGLLVCSSEFTFMVNGSYNNPYSGKWQF